MQTRGEGQMYWGFIGGTGFYTLDQQQQPEHITTPFGKAVLYRVPVSGQEVAFLPRHGIEHNLPPHLINYRANIWALRSLGVQRVLATASVGTCNPGLEPGSLALLTQFLDFTKGRPCTLYQEGGPVLHVDVTEPYCPQLRQELAEAAAALGRWVHPGATYVCTEGPRFETAAEISMFGHLGADVVGMTGVPEVVLAREAGLCYACLAVATNWAAGVGGRPLSHQEVCDEMANQIADIKAIFARVVAQHQPRPCPCSPQNGAGDG